MGSSSFSTQQAGGCPLSGTSPSRKAHRYPGAAINFVLLAVVILAAHGGLLYYSMQHQEIEQHRLMERRGEQETQTLRYLLKSQSRSLENYVADLAHDSAVIAAMASDDRGAASARVGSLEAIRSALPLQEVNVHLSSKPYWLRLGAGESAAATTTWHPVVAETLETGTPKQGFQADAASLSFRSTMPVVRGGRVIGVVEAVADHGALIQRFIEQTDTNAALYYLLPKKDRSELLQKLTQLGMDTKAVEQDAMKEVYELDVASNVDLFQSVTGSNDMTEWRNDDASPSAMVAEGNIVICRSLSLADHEGQHAGFILWTHGEQPAHPAALDETQMMALGISASLILGCTLVAFVSSRKRVAPEAAAPAPPSVERDRRYRALFEQSSDALIIFDASGAMDVNKAALNLLGYPDPQDVLGSSFVDLSAEHQPNGESSTLQYQQFELSLMRGQALCVEWTLCRANGTETTFEVGMTPFTANREQLILVSLTDPDERAETEQQILEQSERLEQMERDRRDALLAAQVQIMQSDKLASVGRLASGVAQEINAPIQYVGDNFHTLSDTFKSIMQLLSKYHELVDLVRKGTASSEAVELIRATEKEINLECLARDIPQAITKGLEGVHRVASIVRAMQELSHADQGAMTPININHLLESAATIARNEYKYVANLELDLGQVAPVECNAGEIGQVFLNLLVNAAHAIADTGERGRIKLKTRQEGDCVEISIADTGTGIPPEIHDSIFDPFFTTKGEGKGTGQGLFIARRIVVEQHGGDLHFETEVGAGTTFFVRLPLAAQRREQRELQEARV